MSTAGSIARAFGRYPEPAIAPELAAQAALDAVDAQVERMAKRYGVPRRWRRAMRAELARAVKGHAGREDPPESVRAWKKWVKGFAAALRCVGESA